MSKIILITAMLLLVSISGVHAQDATGAADTIREKIQEKVESAIKSPRAYIGTVTDISESTIEIRNLRGEIQQISVDPKNTDFVKLSKETTKDTKFSDVAIGDFLIAMGYRNGNSVLNAKRIVLTEAFKPSNQKAFLVSIHSIDAKKKTLQVSELKTNKDFMAETDEATIYDRKSGKLVQIKLADLDEDQKIVVVGVAVGNTITARFIQPADGISTPAPTPTASPNP